MENCVFCRIINADLPASRLTETDYCLAFLDIHPINPGHILVIPKQHEELVGQLADEVLADMMVVAKQLNRALRDSGLACEGVNYFLADGTAAGQEVPHVHLHCIPRFKGDGFGLRYPKAFFGPLPLRNELDTIAETIRRQL